MPIRDSGGHFALNNPDDGTPITEMFKLNEETLLMITEKCIYRVQVADQIDRDRTNPALRRMSSKSCLITAPNPNCYAERCCRPK